MKYHIELARAVERGDRHAQAIRHAQPGRFVVEEVSPAGQCKRG